MRLEREGPDLRIAAENEGDTAHLCQVAETMRALGDNVSYAGDGPDGYPIASVAVQPLVAPPPKRPNAEGVWCHEDSPTVAEDEEIFARTGAHPKSVNKRYLVCGVSVNPAEFDFRLFAPDAEWLPVAFAPVGGWAMLKFPSEFISWSDLCS